MDETGRLRNRILILGMIRILGTTFAGLLGLAFGSFLNVCLSRWPEGESVIKPRSHCRNCTHTLSWWENIPLASWLVLRGRCRNCRASISFRDPLVELATGALWAVAIWSSSAWTFAPDQPSVDLYREIASVLGEIILYWLLVALAVLDAEHLWLPNFLTLPGAALGFILFFIKLELASDPVLRKYGAEGLQQRLVYRFAFWEFLGILAAACLILLIRWLYKLIRHREGIGLGDAKLMALLAAWLGLPGAFLAFAMGAVLGSLAALVLLAVPSARTDPESWATSKLPLGTFLCIGGIVSALWGQTIIDAYLHFAGF
jgi:leader peptidase (prepilin peptidase)/N-methyltransferase